MPREGVPWKGRLVMGLMLTLAVLAAFSALAVLSFGEAASATEVGDGGEGGQEGSPGEAAAPAGDETGSQDEGSEEDKFSQALGKHEELKNWAEAGKRWHGEAKAGKEARATLDKRDRELDVVIARGMEKFRGDAEEHRSHIKEYGLASYVQMVYEAESAPKDKSEGDDGSAEGETDRLAKVEARLDAIVKAEERKSQKEALVESYVEVLQAAGVNTPDERERVYKQARGRQLLAAEEGGRMSVANAVKAVLEDRKGLSKAATEAHAAELEKKAEGQKASLPSRVASKEPVVEEADGLDDVDEEEKAFIEKMKKK